MVVIDFHLTFEWSGSPGFSGVMSVVSECAHCNTTLKWRQLLNKRKLYDDSG